MFIVPPIAVVGYLALLALVGLVGLVIGYGLPLPMWVTVR